MRSKKQLLITICLLLFVFAGCRRNDSSISFSGESVSITINGISLRVENSQLIFKDQSFKIPKPSSQIDVATRGKSVVISIDGKQVYKGE